MEIDVGPLSCQDVKIQQKEASCHYLTPEIGASTTRHYHVDAFSCSENMYNNTCPGATYENDTYNI